jgi:uncharacterized protein DUF998
VTRNPHFSRVAAICGLIGPLAFGAVLAALTLAQYDFMLSLGWGPLRVIDWPSGLALGPYGLLMTLTFAASGVMMLVFALGLRGKLKASTFSRWGTGLLAGAGLALMGLILPTDPTLRATPATWHGILHDGFFVALGLTMPPAMVLLGLAFRRDSGWQNLAWYTFLTVALLIPTFWLKGLAFYVFFAAMLLWSEVIAWRLFRLSRDVT